MSSDDRDALLAEAARLRDAGEAAGAFAAYRACVAGDPACAEAWIGMSDLLSARGDAGAAVQALSQGMAAADASGRSAIAPVFTERLARLKVEGWHAPLNRDLRMLLAEPGVDRQALARMTADLLLAKPETKGEGVEVLDRIAADPLWRVFLTECLNVDAAMEARLVGLRRALLIAHGEGAPLGDRAGLGYALAVQAFAGEYVWPLAGDEERLAAALCARAEADPEAWVLSALYRSPELSTSESVLARVEASSAEGAVLIRRAVREIRRERELSASISGLTESPALGDAVSTAVRAQYEANPYPRWQTSPTPAPRALRDHVGALPRVAADCLPDRPLRVLIAGCGTGYEAIDMARMNPSLAITAMDLSRASLAYGARMAHALGIAVDFRQGDILDLVAMEPAFDVVTSTGVLHHMDDPAAGLAALARVLRPGGVMRVALYSERARAAVVTAHDRIRARGLSPTPEGVRAFRAEVFAAPDGSPLAALRTSDDLYSLSGCRDLVFHVHERRFSLPEAVAMLEGADLTWVGFDAPPEAMRAFLQVYGEGADPLNATLWDRLEARETTLFAGMYPLWGQKLG